MKFKRHQNENNNNADHDDDDVETADSSEGMLESFEPADIMTPESDEGDPWYGYAEDSDLDSSSSGDEIFDVSIKI